MSSFANRGLASASSGVAQRVSNRMLRSSTHPSLSLPESGDIGLCFRVALGIAHQHADPPHALGLLRAPRAARPSGTNYSLDEIAPSHRLPEAQDRTLPKGNYVVQDRR